MNLTPKEKSEVVNRAFLMAGKVGLESFGFTCFFNSSMQALAHVEPVSMLTQGLPLGYAKRNGIMCVDSDEKFQRHEFAYLFQRIVRELWVNRRAVVNPSYLLRSLNRGWSLFDEDELDVHDVYMCIVESLHKALGLYAPVKYEPSFVEPSKRDLKWDASLNLDMAEVTNGSGSAQSSSSGAGGMTPTTLNFGGDDATEDIVDGFEIPPVKFIQDRVQFSMRAMDVGSHASVEHCQQHSVKSMVTDTMQGVTMCRVECSCCNSCTYSSEPFFSLCLDLPTASVLTPTFGRRRASTIIQSKDGAEEAQMFSIGDMLETYDSLAQDTSDTASKIGEEDSVKTPSSPLSHPRSSTGAVNGPSARFAQSIRLHRTTSSRVWCRRSNGMDSIRVPMPEANPWSSIRSDKSLSLSAKTEKDDDSGGSGREPNLTPPGSGLYQSFMNVASSGKKVTPSREFSIYDLLDHHFKPSRIAGSRFRCFAQQCEGKESTGAHKHVSLAMLPEVLVISIRRGTFSPSTAPPSVETVFQYASAQVTFPMEDLDLSKYLQPSPWYSSDFEHTGRPLYNLCSVIVYDVKPGMAQGKHINYSRHYADSEQGAWYEFVDQQVKEVSVDVVERANASMLFYTRQVPLGPRYREHRVTMTNTRRSIGAFSSLSPRLSFARKSKVSPTPPVTGSPRDPSRRRLSVSPTPPPTTSVVSNVEAATMQLTAKTKKDVLKLLRTEALRAMGEHDEDIASSFIVEKNDALEDEGFITKVRKGIASGIRKLLGIPGEDEEDALEKFKKTSAGLILGDKMKSSNIRGPINLRNARTSNIVDKGSLPAHSMDKQPSKLRKVVLNIMDRLDEVTLLSSSYVGKPRLCRPEFKDKGGQPPEGYIIVSSYWVLKFLSFSDPGPPCNHDIACPHGALKPHLRGAGREVFVPLRWNFFLEVCQLLAELYNHSGDLVEALKNTTHFPIYSDLARTEQLDNVGLATSAFRPVREVEICTACNRRQTMLYWRRRNEKKMVLKQRVLDEKERLNREKRNGRNVTANGHSSATSTPQSRLNNQDSVNSSSTIGSAGDDIRSPESVTGRGLTKLVNTGRGTTVDSLDEDWSLSSDSFLCYMMDKRWLDQWRAYVSTDPAEDLEYSTPAPGPISNDVLFTTDAETGELLDLVDGLEIGVTYEAVSPGVWNVLHKIYSGGPALPRRSGDIYQAAPLSLPDTP